MLPHASLFLLITRHIICFAIYFIPTVDSLTTERHGIYLTAEQNTEFTMIVPKILHFITKEILYLSGTRNLHYLQKKKRATHATIERPLPLLESAQG